MLSDDEALKYLEPAIAVYELECAKYDEAREKYEHGDIDAITLESAERARINARREMRSYARDLGRIDLVQD